MKISKSFFLINSCNTALAIVLLFLSSCGGGSSGAGADAVVISQTPVTVTRISNGAITDSMLLSATSSFMKKSYVKANATGYIQRADVKQGQYVTEGQLLFTIKTKEAQSIGNTINVLDTSFKFSGVNRIKAASSGYVTQLTHQTGDYVQDGEQLAVISDKGSFAFLLQVPYELQRLVAQNQHLLLILPDGQQLMGEVSNIMPSVDTLSQTLGVVVKVNSPNPLPENLVAKARLVRSAKSNAITLPKSALLADETQTEFWVMKLENDTTAIKVPVKKGLESGNRVEILSPLFHSTDRIVISGNYGLADTAKIKIVKQ